MRRFTLLIALFLIWIGNCSFVKYSGADEPEISSRCLAINNATKNKKLIAECQKEVYSWVKGKIEKLHKAIKGKDWKAVSSMVMTNPVYEGFSANKYVRSGIYMQDPDGAHSAPGIQNLFEKKVAIFGGFDSFCKKYLKAGFRASDIWWHGERITVGDKGVEIIVSIGEDLGEGLFVGTVYKLIVSGKEKGKFSFVGFYIE